MIEAGCVVGLNGEAIYWHLPAGRTGGSLPDSRELWDVIWEAHVNRTLLGFAHSHPGSGIPGPSYTDLTTFAAIEAALGRRLLWWITSSDSLAVITWNDELRKYRTSLAPHPDPQLTSLPCDVPNCWVEELRRVSQ